MPEVPTIFEALGSTPVGNTPPQFAEDLRMATQNVGKAIKAAGVEPQ